MVVPIPHKVGQLITQCVLPVALIIALTINRRGSIRPNWFLGLYSVLGVITLMMSVRLVSVGTTYRGFRLVAFLAVLWLLTPWWRDRGLVLLRSQLVVLWGILVSLVVGFVLAPKKAFSLNFGSARLTGVLWPIPAPQVGHYMAELTGVVILLWLCGMMRRRPALILIGSGLAALIASHTRTALAAMIGGLLVAALSLFLAKRRVRRAFAVCLLVIVAVVVPLSPLITSWLTRGQSSSQVTHLSGRTNVWPVVLSQSRPETNKILGSGMTNDSVMNVGAPFEGRPIDGSWIATYQNQGIVGWVLEGFMFLVLILTALLRPRGPTRSIALFLIVYCLFSSFAESGMGEASSYLLDLTVAASLLVPRAPRSRYAPAVRRHLRRRRGRAESLGPRRPLAMPVRVRPYQIFDPGWSAEEELSLYGGRTAHLWARTRVSRRRMGWGVVDQAASSLTNFVMSIYILRDLGATQYGAFAIAYVTYSFVLNASRGLSTDPLMVRFSASDVPTWRQAVRGSSGTAALIGLVSGACVIGIALLLHGPTRMALLALGLTLPVLMLQDSWRFAFFALGRGSRAFLNDMVWAGGLAVGLVALKLAGHANVFWFVFIWGASAGLGAVLGSFQAKVLPRLSQARRWLSQQRDLGWRYLVEGTTQAGAAQVRNYGIGLILGLTAIGYLQAANTLMGPFQVIMLGMSLVALPEAVRLLHRSARHLTVFCAVLTVGLLALALLWGLILLVALPRGLGAAVLGPAWRHTYPLILPATFVTMGGCATAGFIIYLHVAGSREAECTGRGHQRHRLRHRLPRRCCPGRSGGKHARRRSGDLGGSPCLLVASPPGITRASLGRERATRSNRARNTSPSPRSSHPRCQGVPDTQLPASEEVGTVHQWSERCGP